MVWILSIIFLPFTLAIAGIDVHTHMSSQGWKGKHIEDTLKNMEANQRITQSFVFSGAYAVGYLQDLTSVEEENNFIARVERNHPREIVGICSIPITYPSALDEIRRCRQELGLRGLKLHTMDNAGLLKNLPMPDYGDPSFFWRLIDIFRVATENKMFILLHSSWFKERDLTYLILYSAQKAPLMKLVLLHALQDNYADISKLKYLKNYFESQKKPFPQIYLELSDSIQTYVGTNHPRQRDWIGFLKYWGPENILFGSDYPAHSTGEGLGLYDRTFSKTEMDAILNKNAVKLFRWE
jgi:predicted TIM-barrel fold metal-dependent hydrolase